MPAATRILQTRLTRRQFVRGAAAASTALLFAPGARRAGALAAIPSQGFLRADERRVVEALAARLVPSDATAGAREAGVIDYIQGLLSAFPGADANGDDRVSAADLTAVARALGTDDAPADVDGSGHVDARDAAVVASSIFSGPVLAGPPAFDGRPIFAGGPFSGRTPFPDPATGTPSNDFPGNAFLEALPLSRLQRMAWTVRLLGAEAVPEVRDNPLATALAEVDLRRRYRDGLAQVAALSAEKGAPFDELEVADQDAVLAQVKLRHRRFYDLLVDHTVEGLLCAPEYGGNRDGIGWQLVGFDGDSQPLGCTVFNTTTGEYVERPDKPNSSIDPDDDCSGVSPEMLEFLRIVLVRLAGAVEFPTPSCFPG
jgi:hypothetical protein